MALEVIYNRKVVATCSALRNFTAYRTFSTSEDLDFLPRIRQR